MVLTPLLIALLLVIVGIAIPVALLVSGKPQDTLRTLARLCGYLLAVIGWRYFFSIFDHPFFVLAREDANDFKFAGYFIVPGWLLLRFAAGLFPFSRRLSR